MPAIICATVLPFTGLPSDLDVRVFRTVTVFEAEPYLNFPWNEFDPFGYDVQMFPMQAERCRMSNERLCRCCFA